MTLTAIVIEGGVEVLLAIVDFDSNEQRDELEGEYGGTEVSGIEKELEEECIGIDVKEGSDVDIAVLGAHL